MKVILTCLLALAAFVVIAYANERPIIGMLSQEIPYVRHMIPDEKYKSFIASSYVDFVGLAGARVVPIWIGQDRAYYEKIVNYTNGAIFHGGEVDFYAKGGYGEAASIIYSLAKEANERGVHYPIMGICLGFQALGFVDSGENIRINCNMPNDAIPLNFTQTYRDSRLYAGLHEDDNFTLTNTNSTYNFHRMCLTETTLREAGIRQNWKVLSVNTDKDGLEFISSMEHAKYPIFGLQFHPSKVLYEFDSKFEYPKFFEAIKASQHFANVFVEHSRMNDNHFPNLTLEHNSLIYKFRNFYTADTNQSLYDRLYLFTDEDVRTTLI